MQGRYSGRGKASELSYKQALVRLLDRPGGRLLLGRIATHFVRRLGGDGVEINYVDGMWARRSGEHYFPDGPRFDYRYADFGSWKRQAEIYASDTNEYWLRHYRPQEGDTIVDVGAGRGEDTLTFSRAVGKTGKVIAVEAHPVTFAILKSFCRLNGLDNVLLRHVALMDKAGTVRIAESGSSWMETSVETDEGAPGVRVPGSTFDDLCAQEGINEVAFLKMNIEGAERYALPGMVGALGKMKEVCIACHDFRADQGHGERFRTRAFVEQFLVDHGFAISSRHDDPREWVRDHVFGVRQR